MNNISADTAEPIETLVDPEGLDELSQDERDAIMLLREGANSEEAEVERILRRLFLTAIITHSADIHIQGRGDASHPNIQINLRTPKGFRNFTYGGQSGGKFLSKMYQLTGTPQGASSQDFLSTRFSMELPRAFAERHGLVAANDGPYLVDVRVEILTPYDGFSFVCRILDQQRAPRLHELGLTMAMFQTIKRVISQPSGLVLVSGPTGSGKTTLLNAIIGVLNDGQTAIHTIENPVEFKIKSQAPVKQISIGGNITFARALRSALRSDPDVILIGEIRDAETMEIALQAAQTGHLVLATLHANSAPETFTRALDLTADKDRDAFRLADTLKMVIAQRLINCYDPKQWIHRMVSSEEADWLRCNGLGHMDKVRESNSLAKVGKRAVIEAIVMTQPIKRILRSDSISAGEIYAAARDQLQYENMAEAGMRAVESHGVKVEDCMTALESNTEAEASPALRSRLSKQFGLSLARVSELVDAYCIDTSSEKGTVEAHIGAALGEIA